MMVQSSSDPARALARRLRELREAHWADVRITQDQLSHAIGVSAPLISSWESLAKPVTPPSERLAAYAAFFATRESVAAKPYRLLPVDELNTEERASRDDLEHELLSMRDAALRIGRTRWSAATSPIGGSWRFADGEAVTIACSEKPPETRGEPVLPHDRDHAYGHLYSYADIDALFELHGHLRAANPTSRVFVRKASELRSGDYTSNLVALGGVDWNPLTRAILAPPLPVRQVSPSDDPKDAYFEVNGDLRFSAELTKEGRLAADVGMFLRVPSPYARNRTITVCCGMYSLGVSGVVKALTDQWFRDRNEEFLAKEFPGATTYFVLSRVHVVADKAITPDWTQSDTILHRWPAD